MDSGKLFEEHKAEIHSMLEYCVQSVPYYQEHIKVRVPPIDEFTYEFFKKEIRPIDKKLVSEMSEAFVSEEYDIRDLAIDVTSGTEGKPLICYKSKREQLRCAGLLWKNRRKHIKGLATRDRFLRFYAYRSRDNNLVTNKVLRKNNDMLIPLFDYSREKMREYWDQICDFAPRWAHGPSTAIFNLAKYAQENNIVIAPLDLVELNGEYVMESQKKFIEKTCKTKVVNNYGSREFWLLGYSCKDDELQICTESVFIESVLNEETGHRELFVSSLQNKSWPLLRYKIGDYGSVIQCADCKHICDNPYVLELKKGRRADFFTMRNGQHINAVTFSGVIRGISDLLGYSIIYQYQVIKQSDDALKICIHLKESFENCYSTYLELLDSELKKVLDVDIEYAFVSKIEPDKRTGKCKDFVDATSKLCAEKEESYATSV